MKNGPLKPETLHPKQHIYHEAGHCVAAVVLNFPFDFVTIVPKPEEKTIGFLRPKNNQFKSPAEVYNHAIILLAGIMAESVFLNVLPKDVPGNIGGHDIEALDANLARMGLTEGEIQGFYDVVLPKALELIKRNWKAVEKIAAALEQKKTLTELEVKEISKTSN